MTTCSEITLRINPERIYFVKFILEAYDGLAGQSTIDAKQGIIKVYYPEEVWTDVEDLLKDLGPSIRPLESELEID
jgi:hypothetical protein